MSVPKNPKHAASILWNSLIICTILNFLILKNKFLGDTIYDSLRWRIICMSPTRYDSVTCTIPYLELNYIHLYVDKPIQQEDGRGLVYILGETIFSTFLLLAYFNFGSQRHSYEIRSRLFEFWYFYDIIFLDEQAKKEEPTQY